MSIGIVQQWMFDAELVELQAVTAQLLARIPTPLHEMPIPTVERPFHHGHGDPMTHLTIGVYEPTVRLLFGTGPAADDEAVQHALEGTTGSATEDSIVVATPISDATGAIVGALRVSEPLGEVQQNVYLAWLIMAVAGGAAIVASWLLARAVSLRLSRPVMELAAAAATIGGGAVLPSHQLCGIEEVDRVGQALADSSLRVNEALVRERRFSADVSHQLRTPLAGVRLRLESAAQSPKLTHSTMIAGALDDVARIEHRHRATPHRRWWSDRHIRRGHP